jgi:hypothetical protein
VLGADLGGQGQGPRGAGLAELARALVQERLQPLAALGIEELGGGVRTAGLHGHHRQPASLERPQDVAHGLRTAPDGLGDDRGGVPTGGGQQDVAAAHREPVGRTQARLQGSAFRIAQFTNK